MSRPTVAIVCRQDSHPSDADENLERDIIGDAADVHTFFLPERPAPGDFPEALLSAQAHIVWHILPIDAAVIGRLKHSRAIIRNGVGFDSVDVAAAAACGIPVCNVPDYGTEEVADHALALTLALCRQLFPLDRASAPRRPCAPRRLVSG